MENKKHQFTLKIAKKLIARLNDASMDGIRGGANTHATATSTCPPQSHTCYTICTTPCLTFTCPKG
ncbi:MAG: hypothetical protein IT260_09385 [Saprospiraceae bacterium]|nr:hypothetical protein [Saprospiraceae bacterium]